MRRLPPALDLWLRAVSAVVPSDERVRWLEEWRAELWHGARRKAEPAGPDCGPWPSVRFPTRCG